MRYPAYPKYKPSEVGWLGQIPEEWSELRLKFVGESIIGLTYDPSELSNEENGTLLLRANNIQNRKIIPDDSQFVEVQANESLLTKAGDILICSRNGSRKLIGKNARITEEFADCYFGAFTTVFRSLQNDFLFHVFNSSLFEYQSGSYLTTTINQLTIGALNSFVVPLPPPVEQKQIANFLDFKTTQIDALIAKKKRLIEKLKEQRIAVITRTMMGRGVEYEPEPGEVHRPWDFNLYGSWRRKKLKYFTYMKGRLGWQNLKRDEYTDSGPCLVSSEHFANDRIQWDRVNHVSQERFEMAPEIILKVDDVLFMKDGAAMGKMAYVDSLPCEACLNSHLLVLRPDRNQVLPQFLYYALKSLAFVAYMIQERVGTTFFGFSEESMGNYPLSFPSVEEQRDILNYLNSETSRIDLMINKIMTAIDRLTEYRTALITAATTGKIDVRGIKLEEVKCITGIESP